MRRQRKKPLALVTSGSGLIGVRVIEDLSSDYRVIGLDIVSPQEARQRKKRKNGLSAI